ncbi:MAG TPA: trehalose-6-phosphate synthase [Steroidobacteraceae bacterium]|nr:trehalose-6-phosphate synthase [Steroidobacteraceae bacterium]
MSRLLAVSNRITVPGTAASAGGLAVGLLSALRQSGGVWFGWSGKNSDSPAAEPESIEKEGVRYVTIDLPTAPFDLYYNGFCNSTLWPLHHYFLGAFRYDATEFEAYMEINRAFATALMRLIEPDDTVWIHDYQLIPLASQLRAQGVQARLGFFLHIPYPNIALLRVLPVYAELVRDLCQYDLVGFQTAEDLEGFQSAVNSVFRDEAAIASDHIDFGSRRVRTGVFPIGVDVEAITEQAAVAARDDEQVKRLIAGLLGRKLMLGVDRLDYSKGLVERFASYRTLLDSTPELLGKVAYIQIAPLSRTNVAAYANIRDALEHAAGQTNGQFADTDWTPVRYLNKDFPHDVLSGFLRVANVAVVTPLRDGMNLVAKEFVAAQDPADPGVLVLSSMAGAARELVDALLVNPYDRRAVALALRQALAMPLSERRTRHEAMLQVLRTNSITRWHRSFLEILESVQPVRN